MTECVEEFLEGVAYRHSPATLAVRRYGLGKLEQFAEERGLELGAFGVAEFWGFRSWLSESRLAPASVNMVLRSVRLFIGWAHRQGRTLLDVEDCQIPPPQTPARKVPTVELVRRLLELPDQSPKGHRDRLILELLYVLGLRRTECCTVNLEHLNLTEATILIIGKGGHERRLPLSPNLLESVRSYLERRPELSPGPGEQALFLSSKGGRMCHGSLYAIVRRYGRMMGLKLNPHLLRHACGVHLIEAGMSHDLVQSLLGHDCAKSTQLYTRVRTSQLQQEFTSVHPRAVVD